MLQVHWGAPTHSKQQVVRKITLPGYDSVLEANDLGTDVDVWNAQVLWAISRDKQRRTNGPNS